MADNGSCTGPAEIREQLQRILQSSAFDATPRNRRFLEYAVEETLGDRADRIKAYSVATDVFGRDPGFDPQLDSIVRIEAGRLRRSLERYYLTAGAADRIRITIPKGSYAPVFEVANAAGDAGEAIPPASEARRPACRGPSILVRAFEEEGDQSAFPNFTRGFTRQVIAGLTRFNGLVVFGPDAEADTAGAEPSVLDVDFILSGGMSVSAGRFGVEALLTDARSGRTLWGYSIDRTFQAFEMISTRGDVADVVVRALAQPYGVLYSQEACRLIGDRPETLRSYEWLVRFHQYWRTFDPDLFEPVRCGLERVIVSDPDCAEAFARLSQMYSNAFRFGHDLAGDTRDPCPRALVMARRAIELAPNASCGHFALALAYWFNGDVAASLTEMKTARVLNPNDTEVMADLGLRYALLAEWDKAVPLLERSYAQNPAQPGLYRIGLGLHHYALGRFDEALTEALKIETPHLVHGSVLVAIAAAAAGLTDEAALAVRDVLAIDPHYGAKVVADLKARNLHPELVEVIVTGLRNAGLPGIPAGEPGSDRYAGPFRRRAGARDGVEGRSVGGLALPGWGRPARHSD